MDESVFFLQIYEVAQLIETGQISPVELTAGLLERINDLDSDLNSYALVLADQAIFAARAAEKEIRHGRRRGPLHGIPLAVKDLCWVKGTSTAAGSPVFEDFKPDSDAAAVEQLRTAGSVVMGKLRMTEGAFGQHHPSLPVPVNPWDPSAWIGVSSSGSAAATAAGLCFGSLGSDTGGSIRYPSAAAGLTGLKTTSGLVSRYGSFELAHTLDTIGPMARSAADCALLLDAIAGRDSRDPATLQAPKTRPYAASLETMPRVLRIGIDPHMLAALDAETAGMLKVAFDVLRGLGWSMVEVSLPNGQEAIDDWRTLTAIEAAKAHARTYPSRASEYGPVLADLLSYGGSQTAETYRAVLKRRDRYEAGMQKVFEGVDLLAAPVTAIASPSVERMAAMGRGEEYRSRFQTNTTVFNMSRNPSLTLPCGFTDRRTPVGFQLVGPHFYEDLLLRAGHAFQLATDFHLQHPSMAALRGEEHAIN